MTTSVSPARHAANASRKPRTLAVSAGETVIDVDPFGRDPETDEAVAVDSEVLLIGRASCVPDE